jgi:opacity protein-like surface antigen
MKFRTALLAAAAAAAASSASAAVIQLNFEGISPYPHDNSTVFIQDFYNGGTSSLGTSGTNYGIGFGRNALLICLNSLSESCSNTSRGGGAPGSEKGSLFFLDGTETYMNVAAGFETGFSFNYVSVSYSGSVGVYDGLNGTGNLLASVALSPNAGSCPGYGAGFCPFGPAGVGFNGVAKSVSFGGVANQIVFDDITFGSVTPNVPEPETYALMALGLGMVALASRRRRQQAA